MAHPPAVPLLHIASAYRAVIMSGHYRPGTNFIATSDHQTTNRVLLNPAVNASERARAAVFTFPLIPPFNSRTFP